MQKKQTLSFLCFLLISFCAYSQESQKLTGSIVGSSDSFDYSTDQCSTTVNTKENAFDNDLTDRKSVV